MSPLEFDTAHKTAPSYEGKRPDLTRHVPPGTRTVLDLGCSKGAVGASVKAAHGATVVGLDINPEMVAIASTVLDEAHCINLGDLDALTAALDGRTFDAILAGDVLEHLANPWDAVRVLVDHLSPQGCIVGSVPNIGHWEMILHLLRQSWPLRRRGIFDNTHLRFFMFHDIAKLAPEDAQCAVVARNYRLRERRGRRWDRVILPRTIGLIPWLREFFVFQYIFVITRA